jgi:predicted dehydrogenase
VAACSIDAPSLKQLAKAYKIPHTYDDFNEMFERADIDLVHVCVPNSLHKRVAIAALDAGKHVVCEKPLATSMEDAMAMVKAVRKSGLKFMYAEDWLSAPAILRAEQIIAEGGIGEPLYIKAKETHNGTHSPFAQQKKFAGGGSMIHLAIHPMAFARWLFEAEAVEVSGMVNGGGEKNFIHKNYGGEDWSAALLTYEGGQRAFIEGNYITHGGLDDFIEIYGSEGSIKIDLGFGSPMTVYSRKGYGYAVEKAETTLHWTKPAVDEEWNLGYVNEIARFVDCVRFDKNPGWGLEVEDGAAVLQAIMAVYESAAKGKVVKLKPLFPSKCWAGACCCK